MDDRKSRIATTANQAGGLPQSIPDFSERDIVSLHATSIKASQGIFKAMGRFGGEVHFGFGA
jgi:hypothetical protein